MFQSLFGRSASAQFLELIKFKSKRCVVAAAMVFASCGLSNASYAQATSICTADQNVDGNTYLGFNTVQHNSNSPTERLDLVKSLTNDGAVSVPCSFDQNADGKTGTWSSSQTVTHILVKASTVQTVFDVPDGQSGNWSTACIRNNGGQQPAVSGVFCFNAGGTPPNTGRLVIKKTTVDSEDDKIASGAGEEFTITIDGNEVATLNTNTNNPEQIAFDLPPGDYSIDEIFNENKWSKDLSGCGGGNVSVIAKDETVCAIKNKLKEENDDEKGTITVLKSALFGNDTFKFALKKGITEIDGSPFELTTEFGEANTVFVDLDPGSYSVEEFDIPEDWSLEEATCTSDKEQGFFSPSAFDLEAGEDVVCTFTNKKETDEPGEDITKVFIHRRVDNLLSHGPDRARMLRRLDEQPTGSLKDGGSYEPLKLAGSVKDGNTDVEFSTSLSQIRAAAASAASKKIADAGLSFSDNYSNYAPYALSQRLDLWVEGQVSNYDDATGGIERDGKFHIVYVGMDYAIAPGVLIGGLVQFDRTKEDVDDPDITGSIEGTGWMAGPYLGVKLRDDLFFDARAAWGKSSNDIDLTDDVAGHRTGSFDTDRWLATASLTGNYLYGNFRVSPQVSIEYGNEVADDYFMSNLQKVNSVDATIGRLTFGPEFGYKYYYENGTTVEPHMSVKGIWTFDGDELELSTGTVELDQFRASIEGGVIVRSWDGYAFRAAGSYDGIGDDDLEAWSAKLWVNIPLN